ncbi:Fe-S-binding ATPase [Alkalilimnicola ehrlichii]|uniref:Iron-sulfur cluster carrier protein n=1 Tax=Alkalilimnicola ehrlichii TaxID=351052 RepID=A0A3E0WZE5_9GAMM|nr:iron-sulfur cluster carrier protein ApbC [Alkalilimnicola ehrlichii]RFA30645.1 Fe-S-binding ATPase [Alkalilimnicola ehrlichii]RFA38224.1 Fe-S-binding ATPase [Alkalilimnicola ehrlichii]
MTTVSRSNVEQAIATYTEPHLGKDLVATKSVKDVRIESGRVAVELALGFPARSTFDALRAELTQRIAALPGVDQVEVSITTDIKAHGGQSPAANVKGVKNIIAVASGKGGVGKSTTAVNLALALTAEGARVGILDADIYGPNQPRMLGLSGRPDSPDGKSILPMRAYDVQSMSSGFLVDEETPMIWRGPMVTQALEQLLRDTRWDEVDYLIVDMPPGTGDVQLTLSQKVPVSGAVIVTTPQDIALLDARKGLKMFQKVNVPVLGIVENMSTHICSQCGHEEPIFGAGGGQRMAEQYEVDLLGSLPLDIRIREQADGGKPTVVAEPEGKIALAYRDIARRVGAKLALQVRDYGSRFPKIVVENS